MSRLVKFSIITVCYNASETIEATINSVITQNYPNYEYIIVDGSSTDGTTAIAETYSKKFNRILFKSEPDYGLYDAMNKGVSLATGDFVLFLNSGDRLVAKDTLEKVSRRIVEDAKKRRNAFDLYFGNVIYEYPDGRTSERVYGDFCSTYFYFLLGDCVNHQGVFARREILGTNPFEWKKYKFCADRNWILRTKKKGYRFKSLGFSISFYSLDEDSQSIKNESTVWEEARRNILECIPIGYPVYWMVDKIRFSKVTSKALHKLYEIVFLRKH